MTAAYPVALLGGKTLLSSAPVSWAVRSGARHSSVTFDMSHKDADDLIKNGLTPVTLTINNNDANLTVNFLYVTQKGAAEDPAIARVEVVDRRWFWSTREIQLGYNMRRETGVRRLTSDTTIEENQQVASTVEYWPWSMKGGTIKNGPAPEPWKAIDVLLDLEERLKLPEKDATDNEPSFEFSPSARARLQTLPVENLLLSGDLATCLEQVLDYFPGVGVFVANDGTVKFYNKTGGDETAMIKAAGPFKVHRGNIQFVSFQNLRPREIEVLFNRKCELRFDFFEPGPHETANNGADDRYLENVLPIPDFSLMVEGKLLPRGTWITFAQAYVAWGNVPLLSGARPLSGEIMQRACVPFNGIPEAIGIMGLAQPNVNWSARITTAVAHYRRTYRINPRWMGRIFKLSNTRVGTLDFVTGTRGRATIYSDYSFAGTRRSMLRSVSAGQDLSFINNQAVWGKSSAQAIDSTNFGTPGTVSIVDEDQGIIEFEYFSEANNVYNDILPSQVEINGDNTAPGGNPANPGPTGDIQRKNGRPVAWDILTDATKFPKLLSSHRAACIISAQPGLGGFPPDSGKDSVGQFHVEVVKPEDVPSFKGQATCKGPKVQIIISGNFEMARVMWKDGQADAFEAAFGLNPKFGGSLKALTINASADNGGGSLRNIAIAAAARLYHALADRPVGSATGTMVPSLEPTGWLSEVNHTLDPSGELSTLLQTPDKIEAMRLEAYLDAGTRIKVLRIAGAGGGA